MILESAIALLDGVDDFDRGTDSSTKGRQLLQ
jgi:hypothetical protein